MLHLNLTLWTLMALAAPAVSEAQPGAVAVAPVKQALKPADAADLVTIEQGRLRG